MSLADAQSTRTEDSDIVGASYDPAVPGPGGASELLPARRGSRNTFSREWLESRGLAFSGQYIFETFSSMHGGIDRSFGGSYLGSVGLTMKLSLEKLHFGRGQIVVNARNLHGNGISNRKLGAVQPVSNLEEAKFTKFVEAYYTDSYFSRRLTLKVGRQYADTDFNALENAGDFLNSSYGRIPTIPMPTYPAPQLGANLWFAANTWLAFGVGAYHGGPLDPIRENAAATAKGIFTVAETKVSPYKPDAVLHGTYHFGVWRQADSAYVASRLEDTPKADFGVYATGDQWFRRPTSAGTNIGPGVFFQLGWSPADRNEIHRYAGGGLAWAGLIPSRSHDSVGVGVTGVWVTNATHAETITEVFYRCRVNAKVFVQPDLQYIYKPAGTGANSVVGGLRMGFEF